MPVHKTKIEVATIKSVRSCDNGYEVQREDGCCLFIPRKKGVVPHVGDEIKIMSHWGNVIHGIEVNGVTVFWKSKTKAKKEANLTTHKWHKRSAREHRRWKRLIADEAPFETIDINGFGGGYETKCQKMLRAGMAYLGDKPNFVFDFKEYANVYGICWSDSEHAKRLDKVLMDACDGDCTGAMHQTVIGHMRFIHGNGYDEWLAQFDADRRYEYPSGLPGMKGK